MGRPTTSAFTDHAATRREWMRSRKYLWDRKYLSRRRDVGSRSRADASAALVTRLQLSDYNRVGRSRSTLAAQISDGSGRLSEEWRITGVGVGVGWGRLQFRYDHDGRARARALLFMTLISLAFYAASCSSCSLQELNDRYHSPLCNLRLLSVILVLCLSLFLSSSLFLFVSLSFLSKYRSLVSSLLVDAVLCRKVSRLDGCETSKVEEKNSREFNAALWHGAARVLVCSSVSALRNLVLIMHGTRDYSRLSVKRQGAHLKSLEKQRGPERLVTAARHAVRYYGIDHLPRARRHYFCWPLHLNAILSAWAKYVIYGSRVSRTTEGFTALGTRGHPSGGPPRGMPLLFPCVRARELFSFLNGSSARGIKIRVRKQRGGQGGDSRLLKWEKRSLRAIRDFHSRRS